MRGTSCYLFELVPINELLQNVALVMNIDPKSIIVWIRNENNNYEVYQDTETATMLIDYFQFQNGLPCRIDITFGINFLTTIENKEFLQQLSCSINKQLFYLNLDESGLIYTPDGSVTRHRYEEDDQMDGCITVME